jgi:hypothetical protein
MFMKQLDTEKFCSLSSPLVHCPGIYEELVACRDRFGADARRLIG